MLVSAVLLIFSVADPLGFSALRAAVRELASPVARATRGAVAGLGNVDEVVGAYIAAGSQNRELAADLANTRRQLVAASNLAEENRQLRILLNLARQQPPPVSHGYLMASSPTSVRRTAVLSIGERQGVSANMAVRAADGLIGRILDSGLNTARIGLLADPGMVVPVRRASDGLPALASGRGQRDVEIRTLNIANNPFRAGDILVTSGQGGVYPPGIPVAIVVARDAEGALARPLADPATVDVVAVLPEYAPVAAPPAAETGTGPAANSPRGPR